MIQQLRHPFLGHFRLVGSAFLMHHVLADQWVVVIIILIFSMEENMFVEHKENMMMDIFREFYAFFILYFSSAAAIHSNIIEGVAFCLGSEH